jgi:dTDP-4-dehydrorhamnose reductase
MRIVLIGQGSFIARAFRDAAEAAGQPLLALPHSASVEGVLGPEDCVINFSVNPAYRAGPYRAEEDCDLRVARQAATAGAHVLLLSSRRVYGPAVRWGALETAATAGDESAYGRNKAVTEKAVSAVCGTRLGIFRLSNIFGYEYDASGARGSFVGRVLLALKHKNKIFFDMNPATRRDFLPVETCARLLLERARDRTTGTFNLGSGFAIGCGELGAWIMQGYGGGEIVSSSASTDDEFFLDMDKWRCRGFGLPVDRAALQAYCTDLGRRLKCEKS